MNNQQEKINSIQTKHLIDKRSNVGIFIKVIITILFIIILIIQLPSIVYGPIESFSLGLPLPPEILGILTTIFIPIVIIADILLYLDIIKKIFLSKIIKFIAIVIILIPLVVGAIAVFRYYQTQQKEREVTEKSLQKQSDIKGLIEQCDNEYNRMLSENQVINSSNYIKGNGENNYIWKSGGDGYGLGTSVYFDENEVRKINFYFPQEYQLIADRPDHCSDNKYKIILKNSAGAKITLEEFIGYLPSFSQSSYVDKYETISSDYKKIFVDKSGEGPYFIVLEIPWFEDGTLKHFFYQKEGNISQEDSNKLIDSIKKTVEIK